MTELAPLPPAYSANEVETAQRFLAAAFESVNAMLEQYDATAELALEDEQHDPELADRTRYGAENMLRASVAFATAGFDSVIKQLMRDALPQIVERDELARKKFVAFTMRLIDPATADGREQLALLLTRRDPQPALVSQYVRQLNSSSFQSVNQAEIAAAALGLSDPALRKKLKELGPIFRARNQIVHEFDLLDPQEHGDPHRRSRDSETVVKMADLSFSVSQELINAVARLLE